MSDLAALRQLTLNRVRVMLREPEVLFWIFFFPVLLAVGIGIAFGDGSTEVLRIGVERGSSAEQYLPAIEGSPQLTGVLMEADSARESLRRGEVAVVIGSDGSPEVVALRYDPTWPDAQTARVIVEAILQEAAGGTRPLAIAEERLEERGRRYIDWLIPGLIGFNLMGTGLWSVGFYITQVRENRELRRLIATPMRKSEFLIAQLLARFLFLIVEIPLIVIAAWLIFDVSIQGGLPSLVAVVVLGASCFTGLGLLAASRSRTTEGVGGLINVIMMPMLVLSGVFFSAQRFPEAAQPIIQMLPLTALNDALRSVYNEGLGLTSVLGEMGIIAAWTLVSFGLALRLFRWQ